MIILAGADLVLPNRIMSPGSLVIEGLQIVDVSSGARAAEPHAIHFDLHGRYVVPGFIDVHVHGVEGHDVLHDELSIAMIAARLPRFGTTAFCPTTLACPPVDLRRALAAVRRAREVPVAGSARVLPAHLESNFINPEFRGAQPLGCLRQPPDPYGAAGLQARPAAAIAGLHSESDPEDFTGADILAEIERYRPDVGIVTLAPELVGGLDLLRDLVARGHHISLGHSAANYDVAVAAIQAGARQATHLFNRMPPLGHRAPGLAGAVLQSDEVAAELICDGYHVHPAMMHTAIGAKRPPRIMAITDGTAGSGLPLGTRTSIGTWPITVREVAYLDDGTFAGSVLTMDGAFRNLVGKLGLTPVDAAIVCATTPARELGLHGHGVIAPGAVADIAVLDRDLRVLQTYVGGELVYSAV
jgi:N-acetylglucosamine-6-phosphate deacetylase